MQFILFGSTGDLASHKIIPQLIKLQQDQRLPAEFKLQAIGRRDFSTTDYVNFIVGKSQNTVSATEINQLNPSYLDLDFEDVDGFTPLFDQLDQNRDEPKIFYLAVGPDLMTVILDRFCDSEHCYILKYEQAIVATEKPFGIATVSARDLNKQLLGVAREEQIYRIDHYLHKDPVKRLPLYRRARHMYSNFWEAIKRIDIVATEANTISDRADYYDNHGGAINDWLQNHLMQILNKLVDEAVDDSNKCRAGVAEGLSVVDLVVGQYDGYKSESGVGALSHTETFAALKLKSQASHLKHIEINLISGKALDHKEVFAILYNQSGETIRIEIEPTTDQDLLGSSHHDAYYNLLLDLVMFDRTNFVCQAELEAQWAIADGANQLKAKLPLIIYPQGSTYQQVIDFADKAYL
jgi:glucose-6-phosphate 1-dehydrogenase